MSIYVIQTTNTKQYITEKEPYKSFLRKYKTLEQEGIYHNQLVIDLSWGCTEEVPFSVDRFYFNNPKLKFSFFEVKDAVVADRLLICHEFEFEFDDEFSTNITEAMNDVKDKQSFFYLPNLEEIEIKYNIEFEKCVLQVNVVIDSKDKEKAKETCMLLISLDIALMTISW